MTDQPLDRFIERTAAGRRGYALPVRATGQAYSIAQDALALLFPHFARSVETAPAEIREEATNLRAEVEEFILAQGLTDQQAREVSGSFLDQLTRLTELLGRDADAICQADPAARSVDEVILAYPGFHALACYRIAHVLHRLDVELLPRLITEAAHRATGIDIHPGARIGRSFAIDHGTGVVIGETSVIGDRVRLYQGVTLGALSVRKELASQKRHPTIEDDVVIYANATILGGDTVVGAGSVIGGNVWLTHSVPPGSVVTHGATIERQREATEALLEYNI
jgi:serine O-acetyltransferase